MTEQPYLALSDGNRMPQLGFGVWQIPDPQAPALVQTALAAGYRAIDTAAIYENERGVGEGLRASGVPRSDIFVTTKLWNSEHGYDTALRAFDASLKRLQLDYIDLYLIHWPAPRHGLFVETWRALVRLKSENRVRSIGVSNFNQPHLEQIIADSGVKPVVNQIELHPRFQQRSLRAFHQQLGIVTESWSPLGQGQLIADPVIARIAQKHGKTPAQVILRWHLDNGFVAIPKSATPSRIHENFAVFDFKLSSDDLAEIAALDTAGGRIGPDPATASF